MSDSRSTGSLGVAGVSHDYSGVVVLRDVSFQITAGEVHGLVGENGSGKSTTIRILAGALKPTVGTVTCDGEPVSFSTPEHATGAGVGVVHQDYHLFADLTVAECVYGVGNRLPRRWTGLVDRRRVEREVSEILGSLGIELQPHRLIRTLTAAEWKFAEIARAMLLSPRFLILDEATASFEPRAADAVLALLDRLRSQGVGLCFVSHRLDEVVRISDRITVLRDGSVVGQLERGQADEDRVAELIVGGKRQESVAAGTRRPKGEVALTIADLRLLPDRAPATIEVRRGEILGLVGLVGSGAATVVRMLGGAEPLRGRVLVDGASHEIHSVGDALRLGIGFIPEDRQGAGLVPEQSVAVNMSLAALGKVSSHGVLRRRQMRAQSERYRERLRIRASSVDAAVQGLSGGNQQKVMIAKWLISDVQVLAIEEPTHGVDIGAKTEIHELLGEFVAEGRAVVLVSTDVHEVLELCDRLIVFRHGVIGNELAPSEVTSAALTAQGSKDLGEVFDELLVREAA